MTIKPIRANFEITNKCNLRCKHCYFFNKLKDNAPLNSNCLSEKEVFNMVKKLINKGILELSIGGGEPFCLKNIKKILELSTSKIYTMVTSNGMLLDNKMVNFLSKLDNFSLQISLDGKKNNHQLIRGISSKQYEMLDKIIKKCSQKIDLQIGFMLCHINLNDLDFIFQYCFQNSIKRLTILPYIGYNKKLLLSQKEKRIAIKKILEYKNKIKVYIRDPRMNNIVNNTKGICEAGKTTFNIDCTGNVEACPYFKSRIGHISNLNIENIPILFLKKYKIKNINNCIACNYEN